MDSQFRITIPNLDKLKAALADYPAISAPIIQSAIVGSQAILAKNTNASTVPIRTGYLVQHWGWQIGNLMARYYPMANYAPYVEFGTAPHVIEVKNARVLANKDTGQIFGTRVNHPGTKPNPFLERIISSAQPEVDSLFGQALDKITAAIASQSQ